MAIRFEWDESKDEANVAKHRLSFELACLVFDDPLALTIQDREVDGEQRYQTVGAVFGRAILVAHTISIISEKDEVIRIMSARKLTRAERNLYEQESTD